MTTKTLGQIAYETRYGRSDMWALESADHRQLWEGIAQTILAAAGQQPDDRITKLEERVAALEARPLQVRWSHPPSPCILPVDPVTGAPVITG